MHNAFDMNEGSLLLPRGWGATAQTVIQQDEGGGSLVMTFALVTGGFDEELAMAGRALPGFAMIDRRGIEIDGHAGDFAEITFQTSAESLHQLVIRLGLEGGRAVTFHGTARAPMSPAVRQSLLQAIATFQHRPA